MARPRKFTSVRILDFIARHPGGVPLVEIQRFAWKINHPGEEFTREHRGYYCELLLGIKRSAPWEHNGRTVCRPAKLGLLGVFCEKNAYGWWVRTNMPHEGHPFRVINREQEIENRECNW